MTALASVSLAICIVALAFGGPEGLLGAFLLIALLVYFLGGDK